MRIHVSRGAAIAQRYGAVPDTIKLARRFRVVSRGYGNALTTDYWGLAEGGAIVAPEVGHLTLTGHAPQVYQGTVQPGVGHLALTGNVSQVAQGNITAPGVGHLLLSGKQPSLAGAIVPTLTLVEYLTSRGSIVAWRMPAASPPQASRNPGMGHLNLTGRAPTIAQGNIVSPITGHMLLTGRVPVVLSGANPTLVGPQGVGHLVLTGRAPEVTQPAAPSRVVRLRTPLTQIVRLNCPIGRDDS